MANDGTITAAKSVRFRVVLPAGGDPLKAITLTLGRYPQATNAIPLKDISITDDILNVSDSACFTIDNADGRNANIITVGQAVQIFESDPSVAGGQDCQLFTGRVVNVNYGSDIGGGSVIRIACMDLGWHLTSSNPQPLIPLNFKALDQLVQALIDPSWGFATTSGNAKVTIGNALNRPLKQGRVGVFRYYLPPLQRMFLPPIQTEVGQAAWDLLQLYFQRHGYLLNVGAKGDLVVFQPDYTTEAPYDVVSYHGAQQQNRVLNNVIGRPTREESIDGYYSEAQCWSTVVKPIKTQDPAILRNPNAQFLKYVYTPAFNPLPFTRRLTFMDSEAINPTMRQNRAVWRYQMEAFKSWKYEVDLQGHSSGGAFYASDSMIPIDDSINGLSGAYYIQSVRRDANMQGARVHLLVRQPYLLNPSLQAQTSGGTGKSSKPHKAVK